MRTADLRHSRDAHAKAELALTMALDIVVAAELPDEHEQDWLDEVVEPTRNARDYCRATAELCAAQLELQGSGYAVEADAERERMR